MFKSKTLPSLYTLLILILTSSYAKDPDNLFDTCPTSIPKPANATHDGQLLFFNGLPCKDPSTVASSDFKSSLLNKSGDADVFLRSSTTVATADVFPGLNTLGLSAARIDLDVDGMVGPHSHPRATEMAFVRAGVVTTGFVDSKNRVFQKRLEQGDVFVFPKGLMHFWFNSGFEKAVVFSVLNGQNPGFAGVTGTLFGGLDGRELRDRMVKGMRSNLHAGFCEE